MLAVIETRLPWRSKTEKWVVDNPLLASASALQCQFRQIRRIDQALDRDRDEITVGDVNIAISEGEATGLDDQMCRLGGKGLHRAQIKMIKNAEDLCDQDAAG